MAESLVKKIPKLLSNLFGSFSGGGSSVVGMSIGSSSIKLVELKQKGKTWKLLHFGMVQLPEDVVVNREIMNSDVISDGIKSLVNQIKFKNKNVSISISGPSVIIKRMSLEVPQLKELQDQVFWEAEQYLPFDVSEVVMDYHMISRSKDNHTDVLFVAVKKTTLDEYVNAVEKAGLVPKIIDVDYFALQNLYEANYPVNVSEAVGIVDLGASALKFVVVHEGVPIFTKDSGIGGKNLTSEIQKSLGLSYADAEMLKVGGGQDGSVPQEVSDLMGVMAENLANEIKKGLDLYNASSTGAPVAYLLLGGGTAKIPGLSKLVEELVGLPTQLLNPFNSISYDPSVFTEDYLSQIAPLALIPLGLALRGGVK